MSQSPGRQLELIERAQQNALKLIAHARPRPTGTRRRPLRRSPHDHRFEHPDWQKPPFRLWQQGFLAVQDWWDHATDHLRGLRPEDADRTRFMARQALDIVSPVQLSRAQPRDHRGDASPRGGRNLTEGAAHFAHDMIKTLTQTHDPAPEGFRIGQDLACTPGKVVFRNDLFELIQYAPQTEKVQAEPVLIVPAWIMKYYILDLSPHNSMVNYLVGQGFTVFMISWCNPTAAQADLSLEDYRTAGVMAALDAVGRSCRTARSMPWAIASAARCSPSPRRRWRASGDDRLASITLMAAQVDFAEAGRAAAVRR